MKILWFSVTPSLYKEFNNGHNGGGWILSLEKVMQSIPSIELGIAFEYPKSITKEKRDGVIYYPIHIWTIWRRLQKSVRVSTEAKYIIPECLKIIEDFRPDIIQVFGSENCFSLLSLYTRIPVIIHMQGCLLAYYNARFPIGINLFNIIVSSKIPLFKKIFEIKGNYIFRKRALREELVLKKTKYFFGRTHWDKSIIRLYNANAKYYYCSEILREPFYSAEKWSEKEKDTLILISTISSPLYKGVDVVLKTAKLLKEKGCFDFNWKVFGIKSASFIENKCRIKGGDVNVIFEGCVSAETIQQELLVSSFYIHPSYIDNSPNSVCEAQILGVPVICCNVGGLSSLVEDNVTGFLIPANDPIKLADIILSNYDNFELVQKISKNEIIEAEKRHNKEKIKEDILFVYKSILSDQ
jgi:glycosyltransferase involved in cell wall biosynthesis